MTEPAVPERSRRPVLTVALLGGALGIAFEAYGTLTAMPMAATDLGRLDLYAWAFTAFVIAQVLAIVLAGRVVDRIGPRWPLAAGMTTFIVGLVLAGWSPVMEVLLVSRFIQGFGAGATNLAFMVVVAQGYGVRERASLMSMLSFCWVLPSFLGPPVAAWITEVFSWHWVFWGIAPFMLVTMALGARPVMALHAERRPQGGPTDPVPIWAALAAAAGAAMLQVAGQWLNLPGLGVGVVGLVVLLVALPRLMPPGTLRLARGLSAVMWTRGLAAGAFFSAESFLTLLLTTRYDFSLGQAGLFLAVGSSGWAVGSVLQAWRGLRLRRDQIIHLGLVCITAGTALMSLTVRLRLPWPLLAVGFVSSGLGMGLAIASTSLANMQLSEPRVIGRNTSSLQVADGLGTSLVTGVAGSIFAALHARSDLVDFTPIYLLCTLVALTGVFAGLRIGGIRNESSGVG